MVKPATLWYRWNSDKQKWKYNHFEFGISDDDWPTPQSDLQQQWCDWKWAKQYGFYQRAMRQTRLVGESDLMQTD